MNSSRPKLERMEHGAQHSQKKESGGQKAEIHFNISPRGNFNSEGHGDYSSSVVLNSILQISVFL